MFWLADRAFYCSSFFLLPIIGDTICPERAAMPFPTAYPITSVKIGIPVSWSIELRAMSRVTQMRPTRAMRALDGFWIVICWCFLLLVVVKQRAMLALPIPAVRVQGRQRSRHLAKSMRL